MASDEYEDDGSVATEDDDIDNAVDLLLGIDDAIEGTGRAEKKKPCARIRIEDYMERRRLLEDGIEIVFDDD